MVIRYGEQIVDEADIQAVCDVLRSDYITQGPVVERFEKTIAQYTRAEYCRAFNSATSALHAGYLALGVGPGDIVWTSPNTFVATANAAHMCGAELDFVDIDYKTRNLNIDSLAQKLNAAATNNRLPKVITPVHFGGLSCEMSEIWDLSQQYGFKVMEDASHAIGGEYRGNKIGSCKYSDITVFSFHPVKIITTGEGGAATTNDTELSSKLASIRSHGVTRDINSLSQKNYPAHYYEMQSLGFNYRMTDIQAALGLSQFDKLDKFIEKRNELANLYAKFFKNYDLNILKVPENDISTYHLYTICVENRDDIYLHLYENGIQANVHYIPVSYHPFWAKFGFQKGQFPIAERYYEKALSLPLHPKLNSDDIEKIVSHILLEVVG